MSGGEKKGLELGDPLAIMCIALIIGVSCWATWYYLHREISLVYAYLRYAQVYVFYWIGQYVDVVPFSTARAYIDAMCMPSTTGGLCARDFNAVKWSEIKHTSLYFNIITTVILLVVSYRLFNKAKKTHPKMRFAKKHSLDSFANEAKELYPHLRLFTQLNLVEIPLTDPVYGMSLTTRQFAFRKQLIAGWQAEDDGAFMPILDQVKATDLFIKQLGPLWGGYRSLTESQAVLCAIALPRVAATDPSMSDEDFEKAMKASSGMVEWCWSLFKKPRGKKVNDNWLWPVIPLEKAYKIIDAYRDHDAVKAVLSNHAYVKTFIWELFTQARRLGVLPPADVRWLRFYDRDTWYLLQSINRQASFAEAAAAHSHYYYERKSKEPIIEPQIDKAVLGLNEAITNYKYYKSDIIMYDDWVALSQKREIEKLALINDVDDEELVVADPTSIQNKTNPNALLPDFVQEAQSWLALDPLFVETNATSLGPDSQIIEIAICNADGDVLLSKRICPTCPIEASASELHNINMGMLSEQPQWPEFAEQVEKLLARRHVVVYRAEFDLRVLESTGRAHNLDVSWVSSMKPLCAMELAAKAFNEDVDSYGNISLARSSELARVAWRNTENYALSHAMATRDLVFAIRELGKPM